MTKTRRKIETEIEIPLCTLIDLMGESLWDMVNKKVDGVIFQEEYEVIGFDPGSVVLKVTGCILED